MKLELLHDVELETCVGIEVDDDGTETPLYDQELFEKGEILYVDLLSEEGDRYFIQLGCGDTCSIRKSAVRVCD